MLLRRRNYHRDVNSASVKLPININSGVLSNVYVQLRRHLNCHRDVSSLVAEWGRCNS